MPDGEDVCWLAQWMATICVSFMWFSCSVCCFSLYILGQWPSLPGRPLISSVYSGPVCQLYKQYVPMRVLHWCLGLAPLSEGRHWQASEMRHHCSCLQHSAKSQEAATEAHDIRLPCEEKVFRRRMQRVLGVGGSLHEAGDVYVMTVVSSHGVSWASYAI